MTIIVVIGASLSEPQVSTKLEFGSIMLHTVAVVSLLFYTAIPTRVTACTGEFCFIVSQRQSVARRGNTLGLQEELPESERSATLA